MEPQTSPTPKILFGLLASMGIVGIGYLGYQNYTFRQENNILALELKSAKEDAETTKQTLTSNIESLNQLLTMTESGKASAEEDIRRQQEIIDSVNAQIEGMGQTLGLYQKYINTDRELLIKYSRTYFLNENYAPKETVVVPAEYTHVNGKEKLIMTNVWPFLQKMIDDAALDGVDLKIASAYRSFDTQTTLKSAFKVTYGSGANTFSADQGYSEHQLGSTVDFTTEKLGADYSTFEKNAGYTWLTENAYKYGFILSYPKGNAYYIFEPWHWRFVGINLALRLHNENKNFVDLTQRDLNEYLINIFDGSPIPH